MERSFDSFGRIDRRKRQYSPLDGLEADFAQFLPKGASLLPFGNGRSYGESCHNDAGFLVPMQARMRIAHFNPDTGLLTAESGMLLNEVIAHVAPHGYFLPVTPGTQFVTLGGAIANDVHGKNHHRAGSFGCHVQALELLRSDGERLVLRPGDAMFAATVGGLGLTGLMTWAELQLRRVPGPWLEVESIRFDGLDDFFALSQESAQRFAPRRSQIRLRFGSWSRYPAGSIYKQQLWHFCQFRLICHS